MFKVRSYSLGDWEALLNNIPTDYPKGYIARDQINPIYEIDDSDNELIILYEIPGFTKNDVDIKIKEKHLHIKGTRVYELKNKKKTKKFSNTLDLGRFGEYENIKANLEDGILKIVISKKEKLETKSITIS